MRKIFFARFLNVMGLNVMGLNVMGLNVIFLSVIFLSVMAVPATAHQCILGDTSATEISRYNTCKNDLMMGLSGHDSDQAAGEDTAARIAVLEAENKQLRARLDLARGRLLDMAKDL